jgi:hypothetical protein
MKQTIVTAAEKKCYPNDFEKFGIDMRCDIWPESPLRPDLYGPETDKNVSNFHNNRPRWINGGMYLGPAGDMRRLFRRAMEEMEAMIGEGFPVRSEQGMLGKLIGKQEVWRQYQRGNQLNSVELKDLVEENLEYHAGLDYGQEISGQVHFTDIDRKQDLYDADFVSLGDKEAIERYSEARGISPVRLLGLPDDVKMSRNPLAEFDKTANWSNMPLYADFFIGSVPAMIHHNGYKGRRQTWWDRPWYHQRLRELVAPRLKSKPSNEPLATVQIGDGQVRYWAVPAEARDRYPRKANETANGRFSKMECEELCRWEEKPLKDARETWWEEVFRDGGGKFS